MPSSCLAGGARFVRKKPVFSRGNPEQAHAALCLGVATCHELLCARAERARAPPRYPRTDNPLADFGWQRIPRRRHACDLVTHLRACYLDLGSNGVAFGCSVFVVCLAARLERLRLQ